jgi:hypothetical protein
MTSNIDHNIKWFELKSLHGATPKRSPVEGLGEEILHLGEEELSEEVLHLGEEVLAKEPDRAPGPEAHENAPARECVRVRERVCVSVCACARESERVRERVGL